MATIEVVASILVSTLIGGIIIGYLAQRSRMCFVGGIRDYVLVKDTHLLKAPLTFLIGAVLVFAIAAFFSSIPTWPWAYTKALMPIPGAPLATNAAAPLYNHVILAILGGLGIGIFAVFAGGCPLRQHVMASEGDRSSMVYLLGFYIAAVVFMAFILPNIKIF
jgi:uncharacterized protein